MPIIVYLHHGIYAIMYVALTGLLTIGAYCLEFSRFGLAFSQMPLTQYFYALNFPVSDKLSQLQHLQLRQPLHLRCGCMYSDSRITPHVFDMFCSLRIYGEI